MSDVQSVKCTTIEFHDRVANSHKFYRAYVSDHWCVFQWGRVGSTGQWKGIKHSNPFRAQQAAAAKLDEKQNEGYHVVDTVYFDYDLDLLSSDKHDLVLLDDDRAHHSANQPSNKGPRPTTPPPAPAPAPAAPATPVAARLDAHAEFNAKVLEAIGMAAADPMKAMVQLAIANEEWEELERMHSKSQSYLATLQRMVLGSPAPVSL